MKRKLHLFSLLFLAAFLLAPVRTMAQVTIGNYTYTFSGDDATITASSLTSGDIVIPTTVSYNGKTYNVTAISFGRGALFKNNSYAKITSITGKSIRTITGGSDATGVSSYTPGYMLLCEDFSSCTSVDFPHLVSLKNCTLINDNNVMTSLSLPELENIEGCYKFVSSCPQLSSISLPKLRSIDARNAFTYLSALTTLSLPALETIALYSDGIIRDCPNLSSISLPKLKDMLGSGIITNLTALTSLSLPELINSSPSYSIYNLPALITLDLPKLPVVSGYFFITELPALQTLNIPELTTIEDGSHTVICRLGLETLNAPKLSHVGGTWTFDKSKIKVVNLAPGCEISTVGIFTWPDASVSTITVNGATKLKDRFVGTHGGNTLKRLEFPDLEEFSGNIGIDSEGLESVSMPKLIKLTDATLCNDPGYTVPTHNFTTIDIHSLKEVSNSNLFKSAPVISLTLRGDLKVDASSTINLDTYPTVVAITDEGTVNDIPTSVFAGVKGGRFVVPKGKAALYATKWNLNTSKTMVYAPVDLKKTTAGTLYASGSITKTDDSFTYGGTVYNNQYDFSHAMTEAECKNPSVLGDNDLGFTPTLSSLTVQNNTNALAGYSFYYASAYADSPTQAKVGDLTLTALPSDNAGTLQGFGTAAAQLNKGVSRTMGGFLFRGNSASVDEIYLPYTPSAVSLTTNLLQAGGGVTVKSRSGSNYDFYWHPGNAAYAAGFYECDNTMIPEYRAWLSFPKTWSSNAKQFRLIFEDGETTGIESIVLPSDNARTADSEAWYTLLGTRLPAKPATAGVYIHGGCKVVVK